MTLVEISNAIVSRLNTGWGATYPSVPVFYDNGPGVDVDQAGGSFLICQVKQSAAEQVSLELDPVYRRRGFVSLTVFVKQYTGRNVTLGYLDYLTSLFKFASFGGVRTSVPKPGHKETHDGWYSEELRVPFWVDSIS